MKEKQVYVKARYEIKHGIFHLRCRGNVQERRKRSEKGKVNGKKLKDSYRGLFFGASRIAVYDKVKFHEYRRRFLRKGPILGFWKCI